MSRTTSRSRTRSSSAPARLLCAVVALTCGACATPTVDPVARGEPALVEINEALVRAVDWARTNDEIAWRSGWSGNAVVHVTDESTLGLCYEWQELVWDFTRPVVERVRWRADGIRINEDTWSAHYAVVVWDPARLERDELLTAPATAPAFVLDPWRHGEPEVYTVADWIEIPIVVMAPPRLEALDAEYGDRPRFGALPSAVGVDRARPVP